MREETVNLFTLLAHTADGAFVVGENQHILFWNAAAQELLGHTTADVLGRPCCEVLRGHDEQGYPFCQSHCPIITNTETNQTTPHFDLWVRTHAGKRRWVNISILASPQNHTSPLIVHLVRDASQKKRHEEVLDQVSAAISLLQGPNVTAELWQALSPPDGVELSDREHEVLALLVQGLSTNAIAQSLSISTTTTRNHIQNILSKLHVHSRLQAVTYALQHHLVDNEPGG